MTDTKTTTIPTAIATRISILLSNLTEPEDWDVILAESEALGPLIVEAIGASTAPATAITDRDPPLAYRLYVDGEHVESLLCWQVPSAGELVFHGGVFVCVARVHWAGVNLANVYAVTVPGDAVAGPEEF